MTGRLADIAFARSGDKGDVCNVGLMARSADLYPVLLDEVTPERVREHLGAFLEGEVEIYRLDNLHSINIVLRGALGGGATRNVRFDQTGKAMGNALLRMPRKVSQC